MDAQTIDRYQRLKSEHPNEVLLLEQPDSYLLMDTDAALAAQLLQVTFMGDGALILPRTWMETALQRLVKAGHKVAVAGLPPTRYREAPRSDLPGSMSIVSEPRPTPFRSCDFCRSERNGSTSRKVDRRAWTYYETCQQLACPNCRWKGNEAERQARLALIRDVRNSNTAA